MVNKGTACTRVLIPPILYMPALTPKSPVADEPRHEDHVCKRQHVVRTSLDPLLQIWLE